MSIETDFSWLKTHLILVGVCAGIAFASIYGVESLIDKHDARVAAQYQALATTQAQQNAQFQASIQAQQKQLSDTIAGLEAQLAQRQTVEVKIPTQVGSLTATQVATELGNGAAAQGDTLTLPLPLAQTALADMQLVPLLQQDKKDLQSEVDDTNKQLVLERQSHKSDVDALTSQITADNKEITALKADCRKSKMKWFLVGYVAGFLTRVATVK